MYIDVLEKCATFLDHPVDIVLLVNRNIAATVKRYGITATYAYYS